MLKKKPAFETKKAEIQKPPVKKPPPARAPGAQKQNPLVTNLKKELCTLIPKLDTAGLAFLIKQARVHIYNMKVEELNNAAKAVHHADLRSKTLRKSKKAQNPKKQVISISATGSGYYLRYQNDGVIFSKEEMLKMVKIVNGPGSVQEICARLYKWFETERRDIFGTIPIAGKSDIRLKNIASIIRKNFKLKK